MIKTGKEAQGGSDTNHRTLLNPKGKATLKRSLFKDPIGGEILSNSAKPLPHRINYPLINYFIQIFTL